MNHLIANAFIDELAQLDLRKFAFELEPAQFDRITDAVAERWRRAGIEEGVIGPGMEKLRENLDELRVQGGQAGSAAYLGAQERARDIARHFSAFAPGRRVMDSGRLMIDRGQARPGTTSDGRGTTLRSAATNQPARTFRRVQEKKPIVSSNIANTIRDKLGIPMKDRFAGETELIEKADAMMGASPVHLQRELRTRGNELIGRAAASDARKGGGGLATAARKVLGPGFKALPPAAKLGIGALGGVAAHELLSPADRDRATLTVG